MDAPTETLQRFADVARRFCEWAESPAGEARDDAKTARKFLAELHLSIIDVSITDSGETTDDAVTRDDWQNVRMRFQHLPIDGYWKVFEPFTDGETPVFCTLSDDLADIYRNLKEGLLLFDKDRLDEAVWEWKFNFLIHWGKHLTGAQMALHDYLSADGGGEF